MAKTWQTNAVETPLRVVGLEESALLAGVPSILLSQ
jgi:hypothetical protein